MSKPPLIRDLARRLRRDQTDAELRLWMRLRAGQLGVKFRRQHPIWPLVADFCCIERLLVIELDGSQHARQEARDERRSDYLRKLGFRVLRFRNTDVLTNIDGVLEEILRYLSVPHPDPLPFHRERAQTRYAAG